MSAAPVKWAGWTFSFLGFRSRCLRKAKCRTSSGRGWEGLVFGSRKGWRERGGKRPPWTPGQRPLRDPGPPLAPPRTGTAWLILALIGSGGGQSAPVCPAPSEPFSASWPQGQRLAHHHCPGRTTPPSGHLSAPQATGGGRGGRLQRGNWAPQQNLQPLAKGG